MARHEPRYAFLAADLCRFLPAPGALRKKPDACDDKGEQEQGCVEAADMKPSLSHRLVEEVTEGGAERTREDESRQEQGPSVAQRYPAFGKTGS
jgi:hypothetical protein